MATGSSPPCLLTTVSGLCSQELLDQQKLCYQSWHHLNLLLLLFDSGTLVTLWINFQTGNVDKLIIDKTLVGKMGSDQVVSGEWTEQWGPSVMTKEMGMGWQ